MKMSNKKYYVISELSGLCLFEGTEKSVIEFCENSKYHRIVDDDRKTYAVYHDFERKRLINI